MNTLKRYNAKGERKQITFCNEGAGDTRPSPKPTGAQAKRVLAGHGFIYKRAPKAANG